MTYFFVKEGGKVNFIHLGLPKTGTTFLQEKVFPKCSCGILSSEELSVLSGIRNDVILKGLKEVYGNTGIILGIREKDAWLKSMYRQYSIKGWISYDKWYTNIFDLDGMKTIT